MKCKHTPVIYSWRDGEVVTKRCSPTLGCGEYLSLGPANDSVQLEIDAADLIAKRATGKRPLLTQAEADGLRLDESSLFVGKHGWEVGRLVAEHETTDATGWTWDPTRLVAGQYEEHCSRMAIALGSESDPPITVTIDSDGSPAAQINGLCEAPPLFTPDDADALADDLHLAADAARQAAHDGYHGPAVVVELLVGDDPNNGVEMEIAEAHEVGADCPMMGRLENGMAYDPDEHQRASDPDCRDESPNPDPDDIPIRYGAPEAIDLTPRQLREQTAAAVAAEDALRDPEVTARNAARQPIADLICADDPGEPVDPSTKFGELAQQIVVPVSDRPAGWGRDLDAIEYEHQRASEADCRDEDEPESPGDAFMRRTAGMVRITEDDLRTRIGRKS